MSEYGVTPNGFVKKRLDEIVKEMQTDLTEKLGFDVSMNPQSFLNVMILSIADKYARLWEVAEATYHSHYPSSAEGVSLDNAAQFGGLTREGDERTKYLVLCTGKDGTAIPRGSVIASNTTPSINFSVFDDCVISRLSFNKAVVKVVAVTDNTYYTVTINGSSYSVLSGVGWTEQEILNALVGEIASNNFGENNFSFSANNSRLTIECKIGVKSNVLELSENLTTETVSSLIVWQSEKYGKFALPEKSINKIVTTIAGFESCYNLSAPTYGRLRETDIEYRQSYLKKIASRSSSMLESITSSILENVDNVVSATAYENSTDAVDNEGRPPHSIEVVVDGGVDAEIAAEILKKKAAGIATYGSVTVDVPDAFGGAIAIRFNRPDVVYTWFKITITRNASQPIPPNYEELIKNAVFECMSDLKAGDAVISQDYLSTIKSVCTGLAYIDILVCSGGEAYIPDASSFKDRNVFVNSRQKATTSIDRIEVVLSAT